MIDGAARRALGEQTYRDVMQTEPPSRPSPFWSNGRLDQEFAELWNRDGLSRTDRRWITLGAVAAKGVLGTVRPHVYGALRSGDLSLDQLLEGVYHFALYGGVPCAEQFEHATWDVAGELGLSPGAAVDTSPRKWADDAERLRAGADGYVAVVGNEPPGDPADPSLRGTFDTVFAELWTRGVLTRRERRLLTLACVTVSSSVSAVEAHTQAALRTGDLSYEEMLELIHHVAFYAGWPQSAQMTVAAGRARVVVAEERSGAAQ